MAGKKAEPVTEKKEEKQKPQEKQQEFSPKYGEWAFLLGVLLSLIVGVLSAQILGWAYVYALGILVLLGFVVGILNVTEHKMVPFLVASIALLSIANALTPITMVVTTIAGNMGFGLYGAELVSIIAKVISALVSFVAPAALIVSLKQIYTLASR